jgi:hypothetical protein
MSHWTLENNWKMFSKCGEIVILNLEAHTWMNSQSDVAMSLKF